MWIEKLALPKTQVGFVVLVLAFDTCSQWSSEGERPYLGHCQGIKAQSIAHKAFKPRPQLLDQGLMEGHDKHV